MKTVPFSLGPLQYCAGCVLLLVQSGCTGYVRSYNSSWYWKDTNIYTPSEGRDTRSLHRILVDGEDLLVREYA